MKTLFLLLCLTGAATAPAQDSTSVLSMADCKGTGTYFASAAMGKDDRYIQLYTYYGFKIFDLQTGRFIAIYKNETESGKALAPYLKPAPDALPHYSWKATKDEKNPSLIHYQVTNPSGTPLQQFTCAYNDWRLDGATGNVLVQDKSKVYLIGTDGKRRLLFKTADDYFLKRDDVHFSKNGRYFTSNNEDALDLVTGEYISQVAQRAGNVLLYEDGTGFATAVPNVGIVRYSFARKAITDTVLISLFLRDRPYAVLPIPPASDKFLIYSTGTSQNPGDGMAYLVQEGMALPVCDERWLEERTAYRESAAAFEAMLRKAQSELDGERRAYEARQEAAPAVSGSKTTGRQTCGYCHGTGSIRYEKLVGGVNGTAKSYYTTDQNGTRRYVTTNYGYETMKCSACKGAGKL